MTAIGGKIAPSRRAGELGIHSLDHFHLVVPDLKDAQNFYSSFGLDVREKGNGLQLFTHGHQHCWANVGEGTHKHLSYLSFGVFEDDFEPMKKRTESLGVRLVDPPAGHDTNGFWMRDNSGVLIEVKVAEKSTPDVKSDFRMLSGPPGTAAAPQRSRAAFVYPRRLSHALVFTPDVPKTLDFYSRVLGLRLSDRSGDDICFMHGIHGSDHHLVAFARSHAPGLHHCSWDVGSIDEIGRGAMHMADRGFSRGWGLGRHVLGSNYFHYVRDPWGSYAEYSADIDFVPSDVDWPAGDFPGEDSIFLWGPQMPEDFVHNYETPAA